MLPFKTTQLSLPEERRYYIDTTGLPKKHPVPPAKPSIRKLTTTQINNMTVAELKQELGKRSLPVSGKKSKLVERLSTEPKPKQKVTQIKKKRKLGKEGEITYEDARREKEQ